LRREELLRPCRGCGVAARSPGAGLGNNACVSSCMCPSRDDDAVDAVDAAAAAAVRDDFLASSTGSTATDDADTAANDVADAAVAVSVAFPERLVLDSTVFLGRVTVSVVMLLVIAVVVALALVLVVVVVGRAVVVLLGERVVAASVVCVALEFTLLPPTMSVIVVVLGVVKTEGERGSDSVVRTDAEDDDDVGEGTVCMLAGTTLGTRWLPTMWL